MKLHELKFYWTSKEVDAAIEAQGPVVLEWDCAHDRVKQDWLIGATKVELYNRSRVRRAAIERWFKSMGIEPNEDGYMEQRRITERGALWDYRAGDPTPLVKLKPELTAVNIQPHKIIPGQHRTPPKRKLSNEYWFIKYAVADVYWMRKLWMKRLKNQNRKKDEPDRIKAEYIAADFWDLKVEDVFKEIH
jgi:hypothetical protein